MCNCKKHARQFCWHLKKFGQCRYGRNCRYRHGKVNHECPYFKANQCVFGVRCWLKHSLPKPATVADFVEAEVNKVSAEKEKKRASLSDSKVKKGTPEHLMKPAFKGIQQILDDNAKLKDENHRLGQQVTSLKKQVERVTKPLRKRMKENEMKVSEESIDEFFDERAQAIDKIKGLEETVTLLGDELEKKNEIINNKNDLIVSLTDEKKAWVSEQNTILYLKNRVEELEGFQHTSYKIIYSAILKIEKLICREVRGKLLENKKRLERYFSDSELEKLREPFLFKAPTCALVQLREQNARPEVHLNALLLSLCRLFDDKKGDLQLQSIVDDFNLQDYVRYIDEKGVETAF
mmetsp:Transcript_22536/g.28360  ORF Transcript_22536/g.28360 Transcript_22536/m.28360 type:complete len:349 (+) Transcript_22536:79-1125(+)